MAKQQMGQQTSKLEYINEKYKYTQQDAQTERASKRTRLQRDVCHRMASHAVTPPLECHRE